VVVVLLLLITAGKTKKEFLLVMFRVNLQSVSVFVEDLLFLVALD
jgi:hypothetical protein